MTIVQTAPEKFPTLRPHRLALGLYDRGADGVVARRDLLELDLDAVARTEVPELTGRAGADLLLLNDGDLTYAKVRLDERSAAAVPMVLPLLDDSLARAVVWAAMLDAVVDGERPVAELVTLVLAALPMETEVVIISDVLKMSRGLVDRYSTPETRPAALELVAQACDRLLAASPAGGSRQLAAARGLIGATTGTARLRGWLDGDGVPDGLAIDTDLRWLILYRLVVLGQAGAAEIEAEFERDRSATGEQFAARCRAALPDADAKAKAWTMIVSDTTVSGRLVEATAGGFWQPEQIALTGAYVDRYFAEMPAVMALRTGMSAERIAVTAYPRYAVSASDPAAGRGPAGPIGSELDPAAFGGGRGRRHAPRPDRSQLIRISPVSPASPRYPDDHGGGGVEWSEELSSGLLQAAPDAILVMDEGRIMLVNDRAEEVFGWTRADLLGQHADVLLTDETRADFPRILRETLANPQAGLMGTIAVTVRRQDGSEFPAEASLSRVRPRRAGSRSRWCATAPNATTPSTSRPGCGSRRRVTATIGWRAWARWPAASPTTSTTCSA